MLTFWCAALIRRGANALEGRRFRLRHLLDGDVFIDGPQASRVAGYIFVRREKVRAEDEHPCPDLDESERAAGVRRL